MSPRRSTESFPEQHVSKETPSKVNWTRAGALFASAAIGGSAIGSPAEAATPAVTGADGLESQTINRFDGAADTLRSIESILADARSLDGIRGEGRTLGQAATSSAAQNSATFTFAIPAGPLAAALQQFEALTKVKIEVAPDLLRNLTTDGVSGRLTAEQALDRLLQGSSLMHRAVSPGVFAVEIRLSDSVEVAGTLPSVASTKYTGTLTQTPQTIQVISRATIEEQGATTLTEALRNVPGITLQAGEGGGAASTSGDMFNMRGFSAANSLFVDGVRDDGLLSRDVFNLEQIEVFSGPTGSDVGRSNAAGYINLSSKTPQLQVLRSATVALGSGESARATFDVNQALNLGERGTFFGNSAVRVNVLWQDGGVAGRSYVERESKSIAPSISFGLNTPTRVTISGQVMRQNNLADYGLPSAASPIGPLTTTSVLAPVAVDQSNYFGSPDFDYDKVTQNNVTLRVERDFSRNVTVRNQTRYNANERNALITSIGNYAVATNLVTLSRQANVRENNVLSNQTNVSARFGALGVRHEASLGLEFSAEDQFAPTMQGFGTRAAVDINNPDVFSPVTGIDLQPTGASTEGWTDTIAFYAFDSFDVGRLRLTGGVRVETYDTKSRSTTAAGVVTDIEGDGTLFSGKLGAVYRLNEIGNVYVSYGSSLVPPGGANFQLNAGATNQNNPNVDPQKAVNYEAGTKWDLASGRLQLSLAGFRTENTNVIFVIDSTAVPPVFNQDDGQLVTGVSLGVIGRVTSRWEVNASFQQLRAKLVTQNAANAGRWLALTPEKAGSLWTTYRLPRDIRFGGGVRYTDRVYISTANTTFVPAYTVADLLLEAPVGPKLILRLNVNNVTDKVYVKSINNNGGRYNPGTPRSVLFTTAVKF